LRVTCDACLFVLALSEAEPPIEQVSPMTVLWFLLLVAAAIAGFFWWTARHRRGDGKGK
jgi:hypothetical protein